MSYAVVPYAVQIGQLREWLAAPTDALRAHFTARPADPDVAYALGQLLRDGRTDAAWAPAAYAFEAICARMGVRLPTAAFSPTRIEWIDRVEGHIEALGLAPDFSLHRLLYDGPPVTLPAQVDFPNIGHISAARVASAWETFSNLVLDLPDPELEGGMLEIGDWLEMAHARGAGMVGFLY